MPAQRVAFVFALFFALAFPLTLSAASQSLSPASEFSKTLLAPKPQAPLSDDHWDYRFALPGVHGSVSAFLVDGNHLYMGGGFPSPDGSRSQNVVVMDRQTGRLIDLGTGLQGDGGVNALAIQNDKLYAGGTFTTAGSDSTVQYLAVWDGTSWTRVGGGINGAVNAIVAADSSIYVGGTFTLAGGVTVRNLARWDGTQWSDVGGGVDGPVSRLLATDDGIYVAGNFQQAGAQTVGDIALWNGTQWSDLSGGMNGAVGALALYANQIAAGGDFTMAGGTAVGHLAGWDGNQWHEIGGGVSGCEYFIPCEPTVTTLFGTTDHLYVGGRFQYAGSTSAGGVAVWDGSSWLEIKNLEYWACLNHTCRNVSGTATVLDGSEDAVFVSYDSSVERWDFSTYELTPVNAGADFATPGGGGAAVAVAGRKVYVGGDNLYVWDGASWSSLADPIMGYGDEIKAIAIDGKNIYVGGLLKHLNGSNIAKWDGTKWTAMGKGVNDPVHAIAIWKGQVYIGGEFTKTGDATAKYIARWDEITAAWQQVGQGLDDMVWTLHSTDSALLVGGSFAKAGNTTVNNIVGWDGANWHGFGSGLNGVVAGIANTGDTIYAVGGFKGVNGVRKQGVAQWDPVKKSWNTLGKGLPGAGQTIVAVGNSVYISGSFTHAGNQAVNYVARWNGKRWQALGSGIRGCYSYVECTPYIWASAAQGNKIYFVGSFSAAGLNRSFGIARWNAGK